jgi:hypothetical protein
MVTIGEIWHANPEKYNINNWDSLTPTQKHDIMVDKIKNEWALMHGIPIYRFWENDIRKNPNEVSKKINEIVKIHSKKETLKENKNKRHRNKIK